MCHPYPYKNVKLLWKFFYINICGFISKDKFLYETRVLYNSYLRFKVKLPTSDSTEITAGGPNITLEGPVPLDAPYRKKICLYLTRVRYFTISSGVFNFNFRALVLSKILWGPKFTLGALHSREAP